MTLRPLSSTKQTLILLNERCERVLQVLRELVQVHREIEAADEHCGDTFVDRAKLYKASFHIQAITSWEMDGEVLHVMAPEIRAAVLALDSLVQDSLPGPLTKNYRNRHSFVIPEQELASFAHPTPFSLSLSRDKGGFGSTGFVRYLAIAYIALSQVMAAYASAVGDLAASIDPSKVETLHRMVIVEVETQKRLDWDAVLDWADS